MFDCASKLSLDDLNRDKGAFFKSVIGTLNHILVGDIIWLQRFSNHPPSTQVLSYVLSIEKPKSLDSILFKDLEQLRLEREKIDSIIINWINELSDNDINCSICYQNMAGVKFNKPYASLISHLFLHQVHHRGQATVLLSQYGLSFGETDLIEIIGEN